MARNLGLPTRDDQVKMVSDFLGKIPASEPAGRQLYGWISGSVRPFTLAARDRINQFGLKLINGNGTATQLFIDALADLKKGR